MIIIGIDPGLQHTGVGIIRTEGNRLSFVHATRISPKASWSMDARLKYLHDGVMALCAQFAPHVAAIEETFVNTNGQSTLKLGQARGALMLTLALAGLPMHEYAATLVKKTVTGMGRAEKEQVAMMVRTLLPQSGTHSADAADALAVAITHAQHAPLAAQLAATKA